MNAPYSYYVPKTLEHINIHPDSIEQLLIAASGLKDTEGKRLGSTMSYKVLSNEFLNKYVYPIEAWVQQILDGKNAEVLSLYDENHILKEELKALQTEVERLRR